MDSTHNIAGEETGCGACSQPECSTKDSNAFGQALHVPGNPGGRSAGFFGLPAGLERPTSTAKPVTAKPPAFSPCDGETTVCLQDATLFRNSLNHLGQEAGVTRWKFDFGTMDWLIGSGDYLHFHPTYSVVIRRM